MPHAVPDTARTVAKAFYAGRRCKRGNCSTDGETYYLYGNPIARRIKPENELEHFAQVLLGKTTRGLLEFSWAGWLTPTTARHLDALGAKPRIAREHRFGPRGGRLPEPELVALLFGRSVRSNKWYSLDYLKTLPEWRHPVWVPPEKTVVRPRQLAAHAGA